MSIVVTAREGRIFEKPENGIFHGVLADVVDLGMVTTVYQGKTKVQPMVRFIWVLNVNGKDGKPLSVAQRFNANLHEKSNLLKTLKQILNAPPPIPCDLEKLIGVTRQLLIVRGESGEGDKKQIFANVQGIAPAAPGVVVPIPADFVRTKDRPKTQAGPQGPQQTFSTLEAAKAAFAAATASAPQQTPPQTQAPVTQPQVFYQPTQNFSGTPQGADVQF
jgi:hypothetical protein